MSKRISRSMATMAMALLAATFLTACDPPMPPEMLAQLAEQSYTCVEGDVKVTGSPAVISARDSMSEALANACVEPLPTMTISAAERLADASVVISPNLPEECKAYETVPFGFDSGVVAYNVPGADSLNLGYGTLANLLNGRIKNWNDPQIAKDNKGIELPDLPIIVRDEADKNALSALTAALSFQKATIESSNFKKIDFYEVQKLDPLVDGEIVVMPNSMAIGNSLSTLGLLTGAKDLETGEQVFAIADENSLASAGTQLVSVKAGNVITVKVDPKRAAKAQFEGEAISPPYQAIFPINMYLCGKDTLLTRAVAGFMLRLDSQGSLGYVNLNQLPESIRFQAVGAVRKGLPTPKVTKKSE